MIIVAVVVYWRHIKWHIRQRQSNGLFAHMEKPGVANQMAFNQKHAVLFIFLCYFYRTNFFTSNGVNHILGEGHLLWANFADINY